MNKKSKDMFYQILNCKSLTIAPLDLKNNPCCYCRYLFENDFYEAELKKCPFCGSTAHVLHDDGGDTPNDTYSVECDNCACDIGWYKTKKEAIEAWNKRV